MEDQDKNLPDFEAKEARAAKKVSDQEEVVRRLNGSAVEHPEEQQLLSAMQENKSSLDFNRAMRDYDEEHQDENR